MRINLPTIYFFLLSVLLLLILYPTQVHAAPLSQAMVRLDRTAPNTTLSGLVCATPSSAGAGTEGQIRVIFPSDFSLSTNESNWTTGTSDLPSGATAWPGISSTAQSVSGATVTFSSNDLSSGSANYCFTFSATSSTTGTTGSKTGTLTTATSGGSTIDSKGYTTSVADDQIGVTARVAGSPNDFSATIRRLSASNLYGQDQQVDYELTYRNLLAFPATDVSLEVNWSLGTIYGSSVPTVDILQYESNTATTAHNNSGGIIDPQNRTITWTVGTIPANYTGTVRFSLRTKDTYQGPHDVGFSVSGRLLALDTATSYSTNLAGYKYGFHPTPTPGPTSTPGPSVPRDVPTTPFRLHAVELQSVTADTMRLGVILSHPGNIQAAYGTSPRNLNQKFSTLNRTASHTLTFPDLQENTPYYFRFTATDALGRSFTSDIYTFTTARGGALAEVAPDSLIVTSDKTVIFSFLDKKNMNGKNVIIVPPQTVFGTQFAFADDASVKNTLLLVRNQNVLGINTFTEEIEAATNGVSLIEIKPNVFSGRLRSHNTPGYYDLIARVSDYNGNITEQKLADLKVSEPFRLYREDNNDPVEDARVHLSLLNTRTRLYTPISSQVFPITNPVYSDAQGIVPIVLPAGKYRAEISGLGYESKTVDFTIGFNSQESYPKVAIKKQPFNLLYGAQYIFYIAIDLGLSLDAFVHSLGDSKRVYNFTGFVVLTSFFVITLLAFSEKTRVRPRNLPRYFLSLLKSSNDDRRRRFTYLGAIHDGHTKEPLSEVDVIITDVTTGRIVFHIKTNISGKFRIILSKQSTYSLTLQKIGYHVATIHLHHFKEHEEQQLALLQNTEALTLDEMTHRLMKKVLTVSFEVTLLLTIGATMLLVFTIGFLPILPFLALSLFNLVFWALHEIHIKQ